MKLPLSRGPLSDALIDALGGSPGAFTEPPIVGDALSGDDFHLALYVAYELHYQSFDGVEDRWEWEPALISFRSRLEGAFEDRLRDVVGPVECAPDEVADRLWTILDEAPPTMSTYIQRTATAAQFREFVMHRSAYHLKEADPHTWAIPRLTGRPKAAMVEIQMDEYGSGVPERMHSRLFADTMSAVGLDETYGAYLDSLPGVTLATVNLMSMFGLHRRWRGAIAGHLAAFEMSSSGPNRRYAAGARRLGFESATPFFDEHVEADSLHEQIAANDLAGRLALEEPELTADIVFGATALLAVDERWSDYVLDAWKRGASSLLGAEDLVGRA
jgi:heme oxygenase-like protein